MTADDRERRTARLAEAAAARTADAAARARRAITKLHNAGQPITFVSVARTAGRIDQLSVPAPRSSAGDWRAPCLHRHPNPDIQCRFGDCRVASHQTGGSGAT